MSIFVFANNITAVLEDGTEVTDVTGSIQNNKRDKGRRQNPSFLF